MINVGKQNFTLIDGSCSEILNLITFKFGQICVSSSYIKILNIKIVLSFFLEYMIKIIVFVMGTWGLLLKSWTVIKNTWKECLAYGKKIK